MGNTIKNMRADVARLEAVQTKLRPVQCLREWRKQALARVLVTACARASGAEPKRHAG